MSNEYKLPVKTPRSLTYVTRNIPEVTVEQRERALKATHYNEFAFPAGMLTVDMLSDSGTTAMTDVQWSTMFLGDESYGRNKATTSCWTPSAISSSTAAKRTGRSPSTWSAPTARTSRR